MEGATHYANYVGPKECSRCTAPDTSCMGWLCKALDAPWFCRGQQGSERTAVCRIGITEKYLQNLHNFTSLKCTDDKRDISSPFVNTLDATSGTPAEMQTLLFNVLGCQSIRADESRDPRPARIMQQFGCAMRSTQFLREVDGGQSSGAPATFARLKVVWDRIIHHGHNGMQVYLGGRRQVLDAIIENRPPDQTPESSMVMQGASPMPDAVPPAGVIAGFVPSENVTVPGPLMEMAVVHDPAGVRYYTVIYYTILYYTILYYTMLYYTILYYTILYCTMLYYTCYTMIHYTMI